MRRVMLVLSITLLLLVSLIAFGCGGEAGDTVITEEKALDGVGWVCYGGNPMRNNYVPIGGVQSNATLWESETSGLWDSGESICIPLVSMNRVFICAGDILHCFDAKTGEELWTFEDENASGSYSNFGETYQAAYDGRIYIAGSYNGSLYCIDANNGDMLWQAMKGDIYAADGVNPIVADGRVYVDTNEGDLYCINADSGNLEWSFEPEGSYNIIHEGGCSVTYTNGTVIAYAGYEEYQAPYEHYGKIYCLEGDTGDIIWEKEYVLSFPYICANTESVFFMSQGAVICLDASNGQENWQHDMSEHGLEISSISMLCLDAESMYLSFYSSEEGGESIRKLLCISINNGDTNWIKEVEYLEPVAVDEDYLYTYGDYGIDCRDKKDGEEIWNLNVKGDFVGAALYGGCLYYYMEYGENNLKCIGAI